MVERDAKASVFGGGKDRGRGPSQRNGFGVRRPIRRGDQHLVTGVEKHLKGVVHRMFTAVGDYDLVGGDGVAGVTHGLGRDGLAKLRHSTGGAVAVVDGITTRVDRRLHDVVGSWEVGLAGPEANDWLSSGFERLGLVSNRKRGRRCDCADSSRDTVCTCHGLYSRA